MPFHEGRGVGPTDAKITVSLEIENSYELYEDETTHVVDREVNAPSDYSEETLDSWAYDVLFDFTGVGHTDGNSWYDVTITACSDPQLVGKQFDFGY